MIRQEQCNKVCRILDDVLANRPTERDSLIVAVRKAFDALEKQNTGRWIPDNTDYYHTKFICSACGESEEVPTTGFGYGPMWNYCPMCGAKMERGEQE